MREHGTHACYVHGPEAGSRNGGCRCQPCRDAATAYERQRARRTVPAYVGAARAREHLRLLSEAGIGLKTVAKASGVSHGSLSKLVYGDRTRGSAPSKRIRRSTETAILAVNPADHAPDGARIDSTACRRDLATLLARGWSKAAISKAIGQDGRALQLACLRDPTATVHAGTARKVHALLEQPVVTRGHRHGRLAPKWEPGDDDVARAEEAARLDAQLDALPTIDPALFDAPWRRRAACRLVPAEDLWIFWPGRGDQAALRAAKKVCASCPVVEECLAYAIEAKEPGVWGGKSEHERQVLVGRRAA